MGRAWLGSWRREVCARGFKRQNDDSVGLLRSELFERGGEGCEETEFILENVEGMES